MVVFRLSCCFRAKVFVFGQRGSTLEKWLYSGNFFFKGKSGCLRAKVVVFEQKMLYSGKVVVIGKKWLFFGQSGCTRAKVVVFGQLCLF